MPQLGAPLWICVDKRATGNQQLAIGGNLLLQSYEKRLRENSRISCIRLMYFVCPQDRIKRLPVWTVSEKNVFANRQLLIAILQFANCSSSSSNQRPAPCIYLSKHEIEYRKTKARRGAS
jgi:hypothetical protein